MYKNTNCFHLAIPCGDLEMAKKFYSETLGCRLDNSVKNGLMLIFGEMN